MIYKINDAIKTALDNDLALKDIDIYYQDDDLEFCIDDFTLDHFSNTDIDLDTHFLNSYAKSAKEYLYDYRIPEYLIMKYVSDKFKELDIENIDFKRHLTPPSAVIKFNRTFLENGKPSFVQYKIGDDLVAIIRWIFIVDSETSFPEDIRVELAYYKDDGSLGDYFLIKHSQFDAMKDSDEIMTQLELPRKNIVKQLKSLVYGNLSVLRSELTHEEKLIMSGQFFRDYAEVISVFIEIGIADSSNALDDYIINKLMIDIAANKYPFLSDAFFMDANYTLGQVIISKLDY